MSSVKKLKKNVEMDEAKSFTPREYQIEILEAAKQGNVIACLGTGTGKTFIAVLLIRENANEVRVPFVEGGKRIFFLVPTVPLAMQQAKTIEDHTDLVVGYYYGEMDVDSWSKTEWIEQFVKNEVLVMTAEIFRIIIDHSFIEPKQIQLLILDECHRAQGDHPYRQALQRFTPDVLIAKECPRIFGLSASLLNGKCNPSKLEKKLHELEKTMQSKIVTASDIADLRKYGTDPNEYIVMFEPYASESSGLLKELQEYINKLKVEKASKEKKESTSLNRLEFSGMNQSDLDEQTSDDIIFFDKPLTCLNSLRVTLCNLGPWCAFTAAEIYLREVESLLNRPFAEKSKEKLEEIIRFLKYFIDMCKCLDSSGMNLSNLPHKLQKLLEVFAAAKKSPLFQNKPQTTSCDVLFEEDPKKYRDVIKELQSKEETLCSIIFVEQRITAFVLNKWLMEVTRHHPELEFIKSEFIVGHGSIGTLETSMSEKLQQRKLKQFREKKRNVLVATQVLEEGMDIRQCNLVIRFDLPFDFRSYVQSKGRARAENSLYILLVEEGMKYDKFLQDLVNFKTIEHLLGSQCMDRTMPNEEDISAYMADSTAYMPYGTSGPRITMKAAISLINRYCACLPSDMATKLVPRWKMKIVDPDVSDKQYECTLRMPINSPLKEVIVSDFTKRKKFAKMSAALKACEKLHQIGEMNEHLVPISCLVEKALEEELGEIEEEDGGGAIPGTNRRRQVYDKRIPVFLKRSKPIPGRPCYLSVLTLKLVVPLADSLNPRKRPLLDPADTPRGLALLTSTVLPAVNPFRIFNKYGKILVTLTSCQSEILLTAANLKEIEEFHRFIFSETLWMEDKKEFSPNLGDNSYYIVPAFKGNETGFKIDWDFIAATKNHPYHVQKLKSAKEHRTTFEKKLFTDAVLMRSYQTHKWKEERPTFHHTVKICYDLTPTSPFYCESKYDSFVEYYKEKYGITIRNPSQPLIDTVQIGGLHMWKPLYISNKEIFDDKAVLSKTKQRRQKYKEYLVPELSIIHPFPSTFFSKVMCLPTILFRLNGLLLAEEIRQTVSREAMVGTTAIQGGFQWPAFVFETSDKELTTNLRNAGELEDDAHNSRPIPSDIVKAASQTRITSFEKRVQLHGHPGPSPSLILQALTSTSAGDEFDLERLEMIGDSFLKYAMSVKTYCKHFTFDEGKLTLFRSRLIQNLNLYQKAKKKKLGEYLITTVFNCSSTWLPPCFAVEDVVDEKNVIKKTKKQQKEAGDAEDSPDSLHRYFTKQVISDKCIADSVEALIGVYLLTCGQIGALRFMSWLGLNPLAEKDVLVSYDNWPPPVPSPIVNPHHPNLNYRLDNLTNGLDRFEKRIGYQFENKAYLLQAMTHPSYVHNDITDCYQRLEFLGDAVLDYLITRQLYEDPNNHSPGELTDLRSSLVNNAYFAALAVTYNYDKYLKLLSPKLFNLLTNYTTVLRGTEKFKFFEENRYFLQEMECFELDEVEVPKALGDVFESVAGAIYLDSGMSLDAVWNVCYPMIEPALKKYCEHVPISPVRELYERVKGSNSKTDKLFNDVTSKDEKTYIHLTLPDGTKFVGVGPNKKVAKVSVAKRALKYLKGEAMDTS